VPVRFRPEVQQKAAKEYNFSGFFSETNEVCQQTVAKHPYKLARLVHHNYNIAKRWSIVFYAWDVDQNQLRRYRYFGGINRIKDLDKRLTKAQGIVYGLNEQLRAGKVLGKEKAAKNVNVTQIKKQSLLQAIEYVELQKKLNGHREQYYRSFKTLRTNLSLWLEHENKNDFTLHEFTTQHAADFFAYLRDVKKLSNKTINGLISNLGIAFKYLEKQSETEVWRKFPLRNLSALPVVATMNAAYTDAQIQLIQSQIETCTQTAPPHRREGYKQLQLFIRFIYYTLARPKEIQHLKVGDIDVASRRMFIKGENSKNKNDDYVELAPPLIDAITKSGIMNYPATDYVFGKKGTPGSELVNDNFFWAKHKNVLELTGLYELNENFSLYSYKHSGAISLYLATKDIKLCQRQMRHQSVEQTNHYLRDLGILRSYDQLKEWKGAI
jgi:integrase